MLLRQANADKLQAEAKLAEQVIHSAKAEAEVRQARSAVDKALEESRAEKERREALEADLATLREKYSALKRRFVDAGRKVGVCAGCVGVGAMPKSLGRVVG